MRRAGIFSAMIVFLACLVPFPALGAQTKIEAEKLDRYFDAQQTSAAANAPSAVPMASAASPNRATGGIFSSSICTCPLPAPGHSHSAAKLNPGPLWSGARCGPRHAICKKCDALHSRQTWVQVRCASF